MTASTPEANYDWIKDNNKTTNTNTFLFKAKIATRFRSEWIDMTHHLHLACTYMYN